MLLPSGVEVTEADKRWASIAIFKKAMAYLAEGGYPSKMLICSMRPGPVVNGKKELWHFDKLAGSPAVFTCPPKYISTVDAEYGDMAFDPDGWKEPVPEKVLEKLMQFKYFREAYDPKGWSRLSSTRTLRLLQRQKPSARLPTRWRAL